MTPQGGPLLFAAMCVIWGIPYLMIRVAVRELAPVTLVFLRTAIAALLLLPFALWRKELAGLLPHWRALLLYTGIEVALAFIIFFALIGEVGPVRATVITYVNPAVAGVVGVAFLDESITLGMIVGFALVIVGSILATGRGSEPVPES